MTGAVVSFSGGQDSTTALFHALRAYDDVVAVGFNYGQRHAVELEQATIIANGAGVPFEVLPLDIVGRIAPDTTLTTGGANRYAEERGLPPSFVPGRNAIMLPAAAAYGAVRGCSVLVTGVCASDAAGYPDCRAAFVMYQQATLRVALDMPTFRIDAPILYRSKADTWALAARLGVDGIVIAHTHTCYRGDRSIHHAWGYGCGVCDACKARAEGYEEWQAR